MKHRFAPDPAVDPAVELRVDAGFDPAPDLAADAADAVVAVEPTPPHRTHPFLPDRTTTMRHTFAVTVLALAACGVSAQSTQPAVSTRTSAGTLLAPAAQRISDAVIQADHRAYETLQGRIKSLNDQGRAVRDYHLSKAQCWLDVSLHEYTRNDRSAFPQAALTESEKLVRLMEAAGSPKPLNGPWDTPLVNDAARLRPDLWARADALKQHRGLACAAQRTACAEVELVHAGNEFNQQQWRHAKPYVQIAEDQLLDAQQLADACLPAAPAAVVAPPVPAAPVIPAPAVAAKQPVALSAHVLFNFDKHGAADMRAQSRTALDQLSAQLRAGVTVTAVQLTGHADRLNSTGNARYNQQLSEKRARTVREALIGLGMAPGLISYAYRGDSLPVAQCEGKHSSPAALQECLLPNRRVEVQISGVR